MHVIRALGMQSGRQNWSTPASSITAYFDEQPCGAYLAAVAGYLIGSSSSHVSLVHVAESSVATQKPLRCSESGLPLLALQLVEYTAGLSAPPKENDLPSCMTDAVPVHTPSGRSHDSVLGVVSDTDVIREAV